MFRAIERRLPEIYLVLALVLTGLMVWVTPPFFGPDEPAQSLRAEMLGHGKLMASRGTGDDAEAGADVDTGLIAAAEGVDAIRFKWEKTAGFFLDRRYGPVSEADQCELSGVRWTGQRNFEAFQNTAVYPPAQYVPAVIAWRMGEARGLTVFGTLRLARLLCALCAVGMGWLALRWCVGWRWQLVGFLLLPTVLFLEATSSQSPVMLGAVALVAALVSRAVAERREFSAWELGSTAGLLAAVGMSSPPYLLLALVLFVPSAEVGRGSSGWLRPGLGYAAIVGLATVWWRAVAGLGMDHNDFADPALQRVFVREHPWEAGWSVLRGTGEAAVDFVRRGTYVVGWNDLLPHHGAAAVLAAGLVLIVAAGAGVRLRSRLALILLTVSVVGPLLGISLAEYVIWTRPGMYTVWGVMPRYWLPVMPFAMVLAAGWVRRVRIPLAMVGAAVVALVAFTLPWMAAHAFYAEGLGRVLALNLR